MYYSVIKNFLEKERLDLDYIAYITNKLENERLLCIVYDKNKHTDIYYLNKNTIKLFNGKKFINGNDEKVDYLLAKKVTNFYSDSNYSIGRGKGKKDDFAIFNLTEAIINYKSLLEFKEEEIEVYLDNKLKRFDLDFVKKKIENKNLIINGDKEGFLKLIERRLNEIKFKQDFNLFAEIFRSCVKDEGLLRKIAKNLMEKDFLFSEEELKKFKLDDFLKGTRVIFINKDIDIEENINLFNKFFFQASKEVYFKNNKIFYPLKIGEPLEAKPLISKVNIIYEEEDKIFKIYFFMKYVLKVIEREKEIEKLKKQRPLNEPVYLFENKELAVASFDVLTNKKEEINPSFILFDLGALFKGDKFFKEIKNFYSFINEIKKKVKVKSNSKKEFFLNKEIKNLENKKFTSEEEVNLVFRNLLKQIFNYKDFLLTEILKQNADKKISYYLSILDRLSVLLSIKFYLQGENMEKVKSKLFNLREDFKKLVEKIKEEEIVNEIDAELLSYIAGNTIKYFLTKRKGEKKVSLIIPIFENARSFRDIKNELDKVFVSFGYDESFNSNSLKIVTLLKGIDDNVEVDKDYFLIGLLDNVDIFYTKKEKGDKNE